AVLDVAARLAHQLTGAEEGAAEGVLVFSGGVRIGPAGLAPVPDPLLAALARRRPRLPHRGVLLTARAAQGLEEGFRLAPAGGYDADDGQRFPLLALGSERTAPVPFRNPEVLERRLAWVARPEAEELRLIFAEAPVVRLSGPLGCGKSRLAWESLRGARGRMLWSASGSRRGGGPGHLAQIGRQLESMTRQPVEGARETVAALGRLASGVAVWVVADGLESASEEDWEWLAGLAGAPAGGGSLRLLLVGRSGTPWPAPLAATPLVRLGPLGGTAEERFARQAFAGLSLPDPLAERLRAESGGLPFALEELLVHLARTHQLRRVVGSFFFGGEEGVAVTPSPRLVGHVEAELARLGEPGPLRVLAACGEALPDDLLAAAAEGVGFPVDPRWAEPYLASGWLADRRGPWGEGVDLAAPVWRAALAATLPPESRLAARRAVGGRLVAAGRQGSAWATYRLLAGGLAGARELVTLVRGPHADVPRGELFDALRAEAVAVAALGEGEELERELLWALLPLGRRLGRLGELAPELDRAQELVADRPERFVAIATVRAELAQNAGRPEEAEKLLRRALAASREGAEGDGRRQALLVLELGRVLQRQGRRREARELLERTLPALDGAARQGLAAQCRFLLGNL
ncbi:MAG TPA: tetratricopeptide repeat protein, partial [Thermoanaerobaculia bacterium]|nr:tetratricopeptide repeat protein [Thermoanaerobaculia bacterium]